MKKQQWLAVLLSCSMLCAQFIQPAMAGTASAASGTGVFITEVYPDDRSNQNEIEGAGGADLFEFVEIYNNSDRELAFNEEYKIRYNYNTGTKDLSVADAVYGNPADVVIPANSPAVLWVERTSSSITGAARNLTEADFRRYHSVPDGVPVFKLRGQDGLNNTDRGLYITRKNDNSAILSEVYYTADDVGDGKSLHLQLPSSGPVMAAYAREALPSAGVTEPGQLVSTANQPPSIVHKPAASADRTKDLTVSASVYDEDGDPLRVKLFHKSAVNSPFTEVPAQSVQGDVYAAVVPSAQLSGDKLYYYFEAYDGIETARSEEYAVPLTGAANTEVPRILITEILPNPAGDYRWGSGNQYEYIEVYNNSNETLDLKDYRLWYLYPGTTAPKQWTIPQHTAIEPYSAAVIWFAKEALANGQGYTTTADFNLHFNSTLEDSDVIFYDNSKSSDFNLPNSLQRGFALSSPDEPDRYLVEAWYDPSTPDSPDRLVNDVRNAVVRYTYPETGHTMKRLDNRMYANPGSIDPGQVPSVEGVDMTAPVLEHEQTRYNLGKNEPYAVQITSNEPLARAEVFFGPATNEATVYTGSVPLELTGQEAGKYVYSGSVAFSGTGAYRYIVEADDESGNRTRVPYNSRGGLLTVGETGTGAELPEPGLSIESGSMFKDKAAFYAYGGSAQDAIEVRLDGQPLPARKALPGTVQLGMQTRGVDQIYQASASALDPAGQTSFFTRIVPKYSDGAWSIFPMTPDLFVTGSVVSVHTGNENAPYQVSEHDKVFGINNHDDFEVMNVHLVLPDGSVVKPDKVHSYLGNRSQTTVDYREDTYYGLGDADYGSNPNKPMVSDFHFSVPGEKYTARYVELDTAGMEDGVYPLSMTIGTDELEAFDVMVDNTDPVIEAIVSGDNKPVEEGQALKGAFTLDVAASDNLTGIRKVEAVLDGAAVELPYATSSTALTPGEHRLQVTVHDGAGNTASAERTFVIGEEQPLAPGEVSPADFAEDVPTDAALRAHVSDPSGDRLDVRFLEAGKYDFARSEGVEGYRNVADREPPLVLEPEGEAGLSADEQAKIAKADGDYLVSDTDAGFPYHRFEIELDEALQPGDTAELYWKGRTLPGRIVTLYAWDHAAGKWTALKSATGDAKESDIELAAEVEPSRYVRDGKIQAMVQDEVKGVNDPFTILWFTDTQYYAESYPEIFDNMGDWIVDQYRKGTFSYAIHTGDIVNKADDEAQWKVADRNLDKLDEAGVPYGVLAGNHDVIIDGVDYTNYGRYVGADRYENNPWYGGQMDNNRNHYDLFSFGGHDFIFLYIGFGLEDTPETIAWANEVLKKHADRVAIVGMHAYLETNGTLSNMAQNVFDQVIAPNPNVQLVLSGHYHAANRVVKTVQNPDGSSRQVIEMLADYQGGPSGGSGYLRLLKFDPVAGTLDVDTYSPYLDDYNFFDDAIEDFTEPFAFRDTKKRVATDYFALNVYKERVIGEQTDIASGSEASALWKNLQPNHTYYWYMELTDEYGAERLSPIYRFTTGTAAAPGDGGGNPGGDPGTNPGDGGGNPGGNPGTNPGDGGGNPGGNPGTNPGNGGGNPDGNPGSGGSVPGSNPGGTPAGSPGAAAGGSQGTQPSGQTPAAGAVTVATKLEAGQAVATPEAGALNEALAQAQAVDGVRTITLELDAQGKQHSGDVVLRLPSEFLKRSGGSDRYRFISPAATVTLPSDMLAQLPNTGEYAELVIGRSAQEGLSANVRAGVGERPAVNLSLRIGGAPAKWTGGSTDAVISLPYVPAAGEQTDNLVIWSIGEDGSAAAVANGHYDAQSGSMVFRTNHFSTFAVAYKMVPFADVQANDWHYAAVNYLSAREIVQGAGAGSFRPQAGISRADFLIMAMNAFGLKPSGAQAAGSFADAGNKYYTPYLAEAKRLGLVKGEGDNRFRPEAGITRQDMMVMLHQVAELSGSKLPSGGSGSAGIQDFKDASEVSGYAVPAMEAMLKAGLIQGTGGGRLDPKANTNRAQAAQAVYNFLGSL
ncbi:S-layer homology domain-containing protein [Shouchella clausii]